MYYFSDPIGYILKKAILFFFIIITISCSENSKKNLNPADSLEDLEIAIYNINNQELNNYNRSKKIDNVLVLANNIRNDSLKNIAFFKLAYFFYKNEDSLLFLETNRTTHLLSQKLNDSSRIAESYWDKANFYSGYSKMDSAYFFFNKAEKIYSKINDDLKAGRMLLSMAIIQKNIKDYTGSEVSTIKAINIFREHKKFKLLYSGYNNLGIIFNELEDFESALIFHKKARNYQEKLEDKDFYKELSLNNIGVVYQKMGSYNKAKSNFQSALLNKKLPNEDPVLYAMLLDNFAYSKMKNREKDGVLELFKKSLKIRDSIGHTPGQIINKIHLAEYYLIEKDSTTAYNYANEANILAKNSNNQRDYLNSLLLISRLKSENSREALEKHIEVNDSIQKQEREVRNKFERIRLETNELIEETERLTVEKTWIILFSTFFLISVLLLFYIRVQRSRTKEKFFKQEQRLADAEILELVNQQNTKSQEVRQGERERISRELHDGVVGKMFGARLSLEFLDLKGTTSELKKFSSLTKVLQNIETEIRDISHDLIKEGDILDYNFPGLVKQLITEKPYSSLKVDLFFDEGIKWETLSANIQINLFRIVQEAMHNIYKHAKATEVKLSIEEVGNDKLKLQITDNGKGFNLNKDINGLGIKNMRTRAQNINGEFDIKTSEKNGTMLIFIFQI